MLIKKFIQNKQMDKVDPIDETNRNKQKNVDLNKVNEKCVELYVLTESQKPDGNNTIDFEYTDKVILFGYLVVYINLHIII
jgi:hypothetical protein